jgi:hypothetical protein
MGYMVAGEVQVPVPIDGFYRYPIFFYAVAFSIYKVVLTYRTSHRSQSLDRVQQQ